MLNDVHLLGARLFALALTGCSMTQTTTTLHVATDASTERVRLLRPETAPLTATWQQEGSSLVGQLAFANACSTDVVQTERRTEVTETRPNPRYAAGAYIAGALLSAVGVAFLANSANKSDRVTCGSGDSPKDGDECSSEAGAWRAGGIATLSTGISTIIYGVIVHRSQPEVELKTLPSRELTRAVPNRDSCGKVESLQGAVIRAELSSGGAWTGTADAQGAVRVALGGASFHRGDRAVFRLESVSSPASSFPLTGSALGELQLQPLPAATRPAARRAAAEGASRRSSPGS